MSQEIIRIIEQNNELVVSSREVAKNFGKQHKNVIRDIENILKDLGVSSKMSTPMFIETTYIQEQNKQEYKEYLITKKGFTLLAMGFNGSKAMEFKLKYIEAFEKMEKALREQQSKPMLPQTYIEALYALAKSEEEKLMLQPKAEYHDKVLSSEGTLTAGNIAEELGMTTIAFNKLLHELGIQYKDQQKKWRLYAKYKDCGYMTTVTRFINEEKTKTKVEYRWTEKGRKFIIEHLQELGLA